MKNLGLMLCFVALVLSGCSRGDRAAEGFGFRGSLPGRFSSPRAIDVTPERVFVIDRTGRVQVLTHTGEYLTHWTLDIIDNGTPTAVTTAPDGSVWIPDTHNSRILHYDAEGNLLHRFGENGTEAGKFQFVTDLTVAKNGNLFITEYGVEDRVQVFSPEGEYLTHWGKFGEGKEDFQRPMAITIGCNGLLYIADAANHAIKVYHLDGTFHSSFGTHGREPGKMEFPYDVDVDADGNLYTVEYSTHRVQKWSADGTWLGSWGSVGSGWAQLSEPWGLSLSATRVFIADTLNHRIQVIPFDFVSR